MSTTPTNQPVPSEKPQDLKFNAGKIDEFVTSMSQQYIDRFGQAHYTIEGLRWVAQQAIAAFGYITLDSFEDGNTLTLPNQVLRLESTGEYYRWDGAFPKTVPAGSTPDSTGGIGNGAWVAVGAAAFGQSIAIVDSVKDLMAVGDKSANNVRHVTGYVPGTDFGGGEFYWNPLTPKSQHNGITIFSPTVPWDGSYSGLSAFLSGTGETDGSGSGCWIRVNSPLDAIHTEWAGHDVTGANDSTASVNACINKFGGARPIRISPGTLKISFPTTYQYHDAFNIARPTSILITNKNSVHIYAENDVNINTDGSGEAERVCFGVINCANFYFSGFKFNQTCTNFSTGPSDTTFTPQENWFGFEIEGSSGEIDDIDALASRILVMADVAGTGGTPNKDITVSRVRAELVTNYTFLTRNLDGVAKMLDCYMYRTGRTWHTFGEDFAASWDTKYMIAERNHFVNPISIQSRVGPWGVTNGAIIKSNVKSGGGIFVEIGGPANGTAAQNVVIDGNVSDTVVNYDGTYSSHVLIIWNESNDYQKSFNGIKITNNTFSGGSFAINDYAEVQMTNPCYGLVIESNQLNRTDAVKVTMPTWYKSIFKNNKVFITAGNTGCEIGGYSPTIDCNYFDSTYIISTSGLRIDEMLITNNLFSNSLSSPVNQLIDMPKFTGMTYTNNRTTFVIRKFRNDADMVECGWHLADATAGFSAAPSSVYPSKVNIGIGDIIHNAGTPSSGTNWAWYGLGNGTYGNLNIA